MENILEQLNQQCGELNSIIRHIKSELKNVSSSTLRISHAKGNAMYYERIPSSEDKPAEMRYLRKSDMKAICSLVQQDYYKKVMPILVKQEKALSKFLSSFSPNDVESIYKKMCPSRRKLITPVIPDADEFIEAWQAERYIGKEIAPDSPEILTERGERVRSKSEKILADKFFMTGIPYRYEYPLCLSGITYHPDFMLLNVRKRRAMYWEHFGMMDDPEYVRKVIRKIQTYEQHGILSGRDILFTYESANMPLNMRNVDILIRNYFL